MENFIVSARKYRPATFDTVIGQKAITNTLKNAIKFNHLAQAFLFTGPRGVGKTTCARILAKTINCQNLTPAIEPCNACESCLSFDNNATLNIFELDAASNNSVDDIRALVEQVRIPPQSGIYKVYIIDEVHMLSTAAFNAFLKTLEEPPTYAKFILATTEKHKILPTILSRCQIYDFRRITVEDTAEYLAYVAKSENITAEPDALHIIAQKADGAMRDALSIFDQMVSVSNSTITYKDVIDSLNILDFEYYFKITDQLLQADTSLILLQLNEIIDNGFDEHSFIIGLSNHFRNLLVCLDVQTLSLLETTTTIRERYAAQAQACNARFLISALDIINKCDINYKISSQKRLLVELALLQICGLVDTSLVTSTEKSVVIPSVTSTTNTVKVAAPLAPSYVKQTPPVVVPVASAPTSPELPVEPTSPAPVPPKVNTGTLSIKEQMMAAKAARTKEVEQIKQELPTTAFTIEQFEKVWYDYASTIEKPHPAFHRTLTKNKPELIDNINIILSIENLSQQDEVANFKTDMLEFIRKSLNNFAIQLNTKLIELAPEDRVANNPQAKYNQMVEKNPDLKDLRDQLQLNIDY